MTGERRLAALEGALSPKAATLLWLEEAHQFGSLPAYVDWLVDQPISAAPLERVPEQARAAAVAALRGQPREEVRDASHQAIRDAIFLVELVLRLNSVATETIRIEGLRYAALFWEMRAISAEAGLGGAGAAERTRAWRRAVAELLVDLSAFDEARERLESRYLEGGPTLFPDTVADWKVLREAAERLRGPGDTSADAPKTGSRRRAKPALDLQALRAEARHRSPAEAADLADTARATTLELLGETASARAIAVQKLRASVVQVS